MTYTVVIPLYNAQDTIIGTLKSCMQQTLKPLEIIVVDDCSTDDGLQVIQKAFGDRVKIIKQPTNQGPSAARNVGWNAAHGDYVAFLDSDDFWHPRKMEICALAFHIDKNIDLLWHDYQLEALPKYHTVNTTTNLSLQTTKLLPLLIRNPVSSSAIVYKRSLALRFEVSMRYCEDYHIALQTVYGHKMVRLPLFLTQIGRPVLAPGGLSNNLKKMRRGERQAYYSLSRLNPWFYLLYPALLLWSALKYLRVLTKTNHVGTTSKH